MKVLITGAGGLIGSAAVKVFVAAGWEVLGFDLRPVVVSGVPVQVANLLTDDAWAAGLAGCDAVVHLAGHADAGRVPDEQLYEENTRLNERVFAAAHAAGVRKIVFASSCQVANGLRFAVAGTGHTRVREGLPPEYLPLDGDAPPRPRNVYARSKTEAEARLRTLCDADPGLAAIAVRFPWVMPESQVESAMWYRTALQLQHDAFCFLTAHEAGRFLLAAAATPRNGYRSYFPACRENLLLWPRARVRRTFFPALPTRAGARTDLLVDLDVLQRELGWAPEPLPLFRGWEGLCRRVRVRAAQVLSKRLPTVRRRWRELRANVERRLRPAPPVLGQATRLGEVEAEFGEGALWDPGTARFVWVDMPAGAAHSTNPRTGATQRVLVNEHVSAIVPAETPGIFWVARRHDLVQVDFSQSAVLGPHASGRFEGAPNRLNDGKCDAAGRWWIGSMHVEGRPATGTLFCVHADGRVERRREGLGCPNGPAWSPDGTTMYLVDSPAGLIEAITFDVGEGALRQSRIAARFNPGWGTPDGLCVDAEGLLWVALFGGGAVARVDPASGRVVGTLRVPAKNVTSCALGGEDGRTLFITTARADGPGPGGGIYVARVNVPGVPANRFGAGATPGR